MAKKLFRGFSINSDISKELDEITKKTKDKGSFWQQEKLEFIVNSASNLVEWALIQAINHIKEIMQNEK